MDTICSISLKEIEQRLENGQNMALDVSTKALDSLAEEGYDVRYGARPLKRVIAKRLLNPLSKLVLEGGVIDGDVVKVRTRGEVEKMTDNEHGWISGSNDIRGIGSETENQVVLLRNHKLVTHSDSQEPNSSDHWDTQNHTNNTA